jgi:hypothetical protein
MRLRSRVVFSAVSLLVLCAWAGSRTGARAAVFRDRASFEAASQNLHTLDFESAREGFVREPVFDGVVFQSVTGVFVANSTKAGSKTLFAGTVGEFTQMTVFLPPGTTAVGCDQYDAPMIVSISAAESVTMNASDNSSFVGFVSDKPIRTLTFFLDFPEPTPDVLLDNLSYGQRRAGTSEPAPVLLSDEVTGRAAALDSVNLTPEPFKVVTPNANNLSADGRTRLTLFLVGVSLEASDAPSVTARAEDSQLRAFDLPVEAVGRVKNLSWMSQVTVRLPDALSGAGDLAVTVTVRGAQSNRAALRVD